MKLRLAFSTCPNDTFMFEAMVHHRIQTEGLEFEVFMADIKELNRMARNEETDVIKVSYFAYAYLTDRYRLCDSGSALGRGCGPLLLSRTSEPLTEGAKVLIPGSDTTAHFLLRYYLPENFPIQTEVKLFSEIMPALASGTGDAGVIIHESRFTYPQFGLKKLIDLGEHWEQQTGLPIPLGGILVSRKYDEPTAEKVSRVLRRSIEFAFDHPEVVAPYIRFYANEMEEEILKNHIDLYVNDFSLSLGTEGRAAVNELLKIISEKKISV